jgi:hypothetical protein
LIRITSILRSQNKLPLYTFVNIPKQNGKDAPVPEVFPAKKKYNIGQAIGMGCWDKSGNSRKILAVF